MRDWLAPASAPVNVGCPTTARAACPVVKSAAMESVAIRKKTQKCFICRTIGITF